MTGNIFGGSGDKGSVEFKEKVDTHSKALLSVAQRQKDIESSVELLSQKLDLLDHNSVKNFRKASLDVKDIRAEIHEIRVDLKAIKEFNLKVSKQLKLMSSKDEVAKLEKYIDLWNPMEFLTRDEMEDFRVRIKKDFEEIIEKFLREG